MVNFYSEIELKDSKKYKRLCNKIFKVTNKELSLLNERMVDVTIVSSEEIKKINRQHRNIDKVTDVISFAFDETNAVPISEVVGEIYICYDKAIEQADEYHHSIKREMCFLFCHGLLHLYGYDHIEKYDAQKMFNLQEKILNKCKIYRERG